MQIEQQHIERITDIDWSKVPKKYSTVTVNSDGVIMGHRQGCVPVIVGDKDYRFESPYGSIVLGFCQTVPVDWQQAHIQPSIHDFETKCYGEPDGAVAF